MKKQKKCKFEFFLTKLIFVAVPDQNTTQFTVYIGNTSCGNVDSHNTWGRRDPHWTGNVNSNTQMEGGGAVIRIGQAQKFTSVSHHGEGGIILVDRPREPEGCVMGDWKQFLVKGGFGTIQGVELQETEPQGRNYR